MDEKGVGQQPDGVSDVGAVVRETQDSRDDRRGTVAGVARRGGSGRRHGWGEGGSARVWLDVVDVGCLGMRPRQYSAFGYDSA